MPSRLVTVEPIPAAKPVTVEKLISIEPLPTKEMERELEAQEETPADINLPPEQEEEEE